MSNKEFSDDTLNMFIDNQLDSSEMRDIHAAVVADSKVRERVCQLKAIRELVGFAYQNPPRSRYDRRHHDYNMTTWRSVAAALIMSLGVAVGWIANEFGLGESTTGQVTEADNAFEYFSEMNL